MTKLNTLKRFYVNVKFEKYGTYTIEARVRSMLLKSTMMEITDGMTILRTLESSMK